IAVVAGWLAIVLVPIGLAAPPAWAAITHSFAAVTDRTFEKDLEYIRAMPRGAVICRDPTLCYWAGQPQIVDLNNIRSIARAAPDVERQLVTRIESCAFGLIQLNDDWDDADTGPLTDRIREAIRAHYQQVHSTRYALFWRPHCG